MRNLITILLLVQGLTAFAETISLHSEINTFTAGEQIELIYCTDDVADKTAATLQLTYSLGSILLQELVATEHVIFKLPREVCHVAGYVTARMFVAGEGSFTHHFDIIADTGSPSKIESFCGPKHLVTDRRDYTMITSTVLDVFDNPYEEGTNMVFSHQVSSKVVKKRANSRRLYAFERFYAPYKKGYGTVTANHKSINDKAFRLVYYAHDPVNFGITYTRQHQYADGEQLINMKTTTIKDRWGNLIGNGTIVTFTILHADGHISQAFANTTDGVASAIMQAPTSKDKWKVTAEITNYARSYQPVYMLFKSSVTDFPVRQDGSILKVGPVLGYMGQFVKDQTPVLFKAGDIQMKVFTEDGTLQIDISDMAGSSVDITICGITKTIQIL